MFSLIQIIDIYLTIGIVFGFFRAVLDFLSMPERIRETHGRSVNKIEYIITYAFSIVLWPLFLYTLIKYVKEDTED